MAHLEKQHKLSQEYDLDTLLEEKQLAEYKAEKAKELLDKYRSIILPETCLSVDQVAKALAIPNFGEKKLFDYLRFKEFIQPDPSIEPYQEQIEQELAVVETKTTYNGFEKHMKLQTKFTFKGLKWLTNTLIADNYPINTTAEVIWDYYNIFD